MKNFFHQPIWQAGFRPFFTLAIISGALYPLIWAAAFSGTIQLPGGGLSTLQWHAHEMFFGFGWSMIGGFLLTASKNWVKIRGIHGFPLAFAVLAWCVERAVILFRADIPALLWWPLVNGSVIFIAAYVVWSLVRYRKQDTFSDNYFFIVALPLFVVAKNLILVDETFATGWVMSLGLFRLAFIVMLERTVTQFMKSAMAIQLRRIKPLDMSIKGLAMLSVFQPFLPLPLGVVALALLAALLLIRFFLWRPLAGLSQFNIAVMYVGYLGIVLHLVLECLRVAGNLPVVGAIATHTFVFLTMAIIIPAMLIRICQGHTGRKLQFTRSDRAAIWIMGVGAMFRLLATQLWPANYALWIACAAGAWFLCFSLLGFRLIPFLWQARVDGREH